MTIRKALLGIVLFIGQTVLALHYGQSDDLKVVILLAVPTLGYIVYKWLANKYETP